MLLSLLAAAAPAGAQASSQIGLQPPPAGGQQLQNQEQTSAPADGRKNQKVERITHEDSGSRIDELRYGGQTQSIVVQPKANVPAYEIQPSGVRVWNVLKF